MIEELKKSHEFQMELKALREKHMIPPPMFHPKNNIAVEEWKYTSGWIAGFEFLYSQLTGAKK